MYAFIEDSSLWVVVLETDLDSKGGTHPNDTRVDPFSPKVYSNVQSKVNDKNIIPELPNDILSYILQFVTKPTSSLFRVSKKLDELATKAFNPDDKALYRAIEKRSIESVKKLLLDSRVNPTVCDNKALIEASRNGELEIVKLLLADSRIDPSACSDRAVWTTSKNGHTKIVKLLCADPRVNPSAVSSIPLNVARNTCNLIIKLLSNNPRMQ